MTTISRAKLTIHGLSHFSMDEATTTGDELRWRQEGWLDGGGGMPLLAVSSIVVFLLCLTWQIDEYEEQLRRRAQAGLCVLLLLGLLALAVLAHHALFDADGRLVAVPAVSAWWRGQSSEGGASPAADTDRGSGGTSPWAVAAVVALLLVLASHKSSFQMFRPPLYHK